MPYRLKPGDKKVIQVKKGADWVDKFKHNSVSSAKKQLYILNRKVKE